MAFVRHPVVLWSTLTVFLVTLGVNGLFWALRSPSPLYAESGAGLPADQLYERTHRAVVSIVALRNVGSGSTVSEEILGSGFVWDSLGHIVTSHHVVSRAAALYAVLPDGSREEIALVGSDPIADVAVGKVANRENVALIPWGSSQQARVGQPVYIIGNPFGLESSLSSGLISGVNRHTLPDGTIPLSFQSFIQTDAAINHGNSGGPILDDRGNLLGMASAMVSPSAGSVGVGFCVPLHELQPVVKALIEGDRVEHPHPGFHLSHDWLQAGKLVIRQIWKQGPADLAGLKAGDAILWIDSTPMTQISDFYAVMRSARVGQVMTMTIERNNTPYDVSLTLMSATGFLEPIP